MGEALLFPFWILAQVCVAVLVLRAGQCKKDICSGLEMCLIERIGKFQLDPKGSKLYNSYNFSASHWNRSPRDWCMKQSLFSTYAHSDAGGVIFPLFSISLQSVKERPNPLSVGVIFSGGIRCTILD